MKRLFGFIFGALVGAAIGYPTSYVFQPEAFRMKVSFPKYLEVFKDILSMGDNPLGQELMLRAVVTMAVLALIGGMLGAMRSK